MMGDCESMTSTIRKDLEQLGNKEENASCRFAELVESRQIQLDSREQCAQQLLLHPSSPDGARLDIDAGQWSNNPDGFSTLQLLLYQPHLVVDFGALTAKRFEATYGVTAKQMARLVELGYVIPSLYHFDSYRSSVQRTPGMAHGYELPECAHLLPLLHSAECRVASRRRVGMWRALNVSVLQPEAYEHLFHDAIWGATDEVRERVARNHDRQGAVTMLANQFAYLRPLSSALPEAAAWVERIEMEGISSTTLEHVSRQLRGMKHVLAAPLTAAHGGVCYLTRGAYTEMLHSASVVGLRPEDLPTPERHVRLDLLDDHVRAALELVARLGLSRSFAELTSTSRDLRFPWPPSDVQFDRYLEALAALQPSRKQLAILIDRLRRVGRSEEIGVWSEYLDLLTKINSDRAIKAALLDKGSVVGGSMVVLGAVGALLGVEVGPLVPAAMSFAGIGAGVLVASWNNRRATDPLSDPSPRMALLKDWKDISGTMLR